MPAEDPRTCAMIRKADTQGTFQIGSRAPDEYAPASKAAHEANGPTVHYPESRTLPAPACYAGFD
ncbi:hypothetical protein [Pelagibacterium sp. H642]|uniref:hypothetical protein n=1 Tax=Pelagibacterium sp. H642 TaxID=1881069 RepID=UPI0035C192E0